MKKLILIVVVGITVVSCTIESVTNNSTTTINNNTNYYGTNKDSIGFVLITPPIKDKDTIIEIGG